MTEVLSSTLTLQEVGVQEYKHGALVQVAVTYMMVRGYNCLRRNRAMGVASHDNLVHGGFANAREV